MDEKRNARIEHNYDARTHRKKIDAKKGKLNKLLAKNNDPQTDSICPDHHSKARNNHLEKETHQKETAIPKNLD